MSRYSEIIKAKDGNLVPVANGRPLHSSYNPVREASQFAAQFDENTSFFIVFGIAGAYHLHALRNRFPKAFIVAVERDEESLNFIKEIPQVQSCLTDSNMRLISLPKLKESILATFLPVKHTHLSLCSLRSWEGAFADTFKEGREIVQKALNEVSADFSVQSHFGGLWQRNIFSNLSLFKEPSPSIHHLPEFDTSKICAIIAAGPSLDESYQKLIDKRSEYIIIATDTANSALVKRGIISDGVISVDAQMVSYNHFFSLHPQTLCIFDLCANPAAVRYCLNNGNKIFFTANNHPLERLAAQFQGKTYFPVLTAGAGTVTVSAVAFARWLGFSKIELFGADFAYSNGKAYTRGTYLDSLYNQQSLRLTPAETQFDRLCFRTPLMQLHQNSSTTEVLQRYKESLEVFLAESHFKSQGNNSYSLTGTPTPPFRLDSFSFEKFIMIINKLCREDSSLLEETLLPYGAFLMHRSQFLKESENQDFIRLAHSKTLVYTKIS